MKWNVRKFKLVKPNERAVTCSWVKVNRVEVKCLHVQCNGVEISVRGCISLLEAMLII